MQVRALKKTKDTIGTKSYLDNWKRLDGLKCTRCGSYNCGYQEDDRGDFEDHCFACGKTWWVDGPDY